MNESGLAWDPEIDTPATIAVIGGGPSGVEAAVYARFLGYAVELYDAHKVGDSLIQWGNHPMRGTWRDLTSSLGLAAIEAHEHPLPNPDQTPTYGEFVEQYLLPLARTDLLYSSVSIHTTLKSVSRLGCLFEDRISLEKRAEQEFRLLLESNQRGQFTQIVDIVLDCSGTESARRGLASGGGLPIGWDAVANLVHSGRRRVLTRERDNFAGKRVMLFGNDDAAASNAIDLYELTQSSGTQLFWVRRKRLDSSAKSASAPTGDSTPPDPTASHTAAMTPSESNGYFTQPSEVRSQADAIYQQADGLAVVPLSAWGIEAIRQESNRLVITLQTSEEETLDFTVDQLINCSETTSRSSYHQELMLSTAEKAESLGDSNAIAHNLGLAALTGEPHFYRLGSAAGKLSSIQIDQPGTHPYELIRQQIRYVFGLIGGRPELNLYATVKPQGQHG